MTAKKKPESTDHGDQKPKDAPDEKPTEDVRQMHQRIEREASGGAK